MYAPEGVEKQLEGLVGEWTDTFDWRLVGDGDAIELDGEVDGLRLLAHRPPAADGRGRDRARRQAPRVHLRHRPGWSCEAFGRGADLVLSEATYQHDDIRAPIHLSARQAGEHARGTRRARRLMLTHLWPTIDPIASVEEGSEAFGKAVVLAAPHLVTRL